MSTRLDTFNTLLVVKTSYNVFILGSQKRIMKIVVWTFAICEGVTLLLVSDTAAYRITLSQRAPKYKEK